MKLAIPATCLAVSLALPAFLLSAEPKVDFSREIRPILVKKCFACHGPDDEHREAGLRLDQRDVATSKLESGLAAIVPGMSGESELLRRITTEDEAERMPPKETGITLTAEQISLLRRWIDEGASFAPHWALVKPTKPPLPEVKQSDWSANPIDHFVLAPLEAEGLEPSKRADPYALIRRLSLDLRGIPPTPDEVEDFVAACADGGEGERLAYHRLVDRFLADSAFGERWARMWLDQARYADSRGYGSDPLRPNMWRYRDWVINAFNAGMPYDQITVEQVAGDLLPNATVEQRVATGFHRNTMTNTEGGTDDEEFRVAAVKDRADTTMQVWMGITIGCAKCHNHKYEPISQREYYQFYAIFNQTADADRGDDSPNLSAPTLEYELQATRIEHQIAALKEQLAAPSAELTAEQAKWEASLVSQSTWQPLRPTELKSAGGAALQASADGNITVSDENPAQDTFTIRGHFDQGPITGVRLETIPHAAAPGGGAGRSPSGDFRLTGFKVTAEAEDAAKSVPGRYVRIDLPGEKKILALAEVQAFAVGGENIAPKGKATQSSVAFEGPANLAIDGNTDGRYFDSKSVTHTAEENNPWWEVDLGSDQPLERIVLWNRTDGGASIAMRLTGYKISVLDATKKVVWESSPEGYPDPSQEIATSGALTLPIGRAAADFADAKTSIESLIKKPADPKRGWSVSNQRDKPHWAVFVLEKPLEISKPTAVSITLEFQGPEPQQSLAMFRFVTTSDAVLPRRIGVPEDVLAIIDTPADQRTADQQRRLAEHYRTIAPALKPIREQIAALEKSKPAMPTVPVMQELTQPERRKTWLMVKGNFLNKGEEVTPGLPSAFHKLAEGSAPDRLALAKWLVQPDNPLTARVAVNRFWAQLFGAGLVETEEDFGLQGELPSHPELLDWLACEFSDASQKRSGAWDIKALLKLIVTSETYCQTSRVTPELLAKDPRNRLLSRGARFRLEAEMVRDQALSLAGLLSNKLRGPSVYPPQPDGLWQAAFNGERTWPTSQGEDRYRRGLYTFWRRTIPYPSMTTFDAPSREICSLRRFRTNTPLQAFVTMNDPVYVEASQALGRRIMREGGTSPTERAAFGLRLCLVRPPTEAQIDELVRLYESELAHYRTNPAEAAKLATDPLGPLPDGVDPAEAAAWTVVANVLLNLDGVLMRG